MIIKHYAAQLNPWKDRDGYYITFKDFPHLLTECRYRENAILTASEALERFLEDHLEHNKALPKAKPITSEDFAIQTILKIKCS